MLDTARKQVLIVNQASTTNGATASGYVDTDGYESCVINVYTTTSNDATNNLSVLNVAQGDTTSAFTNISGFVGDTDFTIANAATAATNITGPVATFEIDCRGKQRYLQVSASPTTTQTITVTASLGRAKEAPTSTTDVNADVVVRG